jgi:hypothetical protein
MTLLCIKWSSLGDHLKTRHICPVFKWSKARLFYTKEYLFYDFILCIKRSRLADHLKTRHIYPVFEWFKQKGHHTNPKPNIIVWFSNGPKLDHFIQKNICFMTYSLYKTV